MSETHSKYILGIFGLALFGISAAMLAKIITGILEIDFNAYEYLLLGTITIGVVGAMAFAIILIKDALTRYKQKT